MSGVGSTAATRSALLSLKKRLDQVQRAASLLRRKRESLVNELFDRSKPAIDGRRAIDEQARSAWRALLEALDASGGSALAATGWPTRPVHVELEPSSVWGLKLVELKRPPQVVRSPAARGTALGPHDAAAAQAAGELERLIEQVLEAAPRELLMRRLGDELARTTRLVNTLEQRVTGTLGEALRRGRRALEEREREEGLRLKRVARRLKVGPSR